MVETPLPRLICFMGSLEMLLDSESLSAVNTLMLLDNLLDQAGLYGIHFFLFGKILGSYELNHIILTKFLKENSLSHLPLEKQEVARTYLSEDSSKTIYRSDTDTILSRLSQIGVFIKDVVDNYPDSASNYSLLKELFDEQFIIKDGKVELRDKTTVNLANLQGLNDFDASVSD